MNHLAHIYLSYEEPGIMAGNLIGDFVKGKKALGKLPKIVQKGVLLHRKIDSYTDHHPVVKKTVNRLKPHFGKYAPVVSDVYYDYFLSKEWKKYSNIPLQAYANIAYRKLIAYQLWMPGKLGKHFPTMLEHNWLLGYSSLKGIQFTFDRLSKRTKFKDNFDKASQVLTEHEAGLLADFKVFFPDLVKYVNEQKNEIIPQSGMKS